MDITLTLPLTAKSVPEGKTADTFSSLKSYIVTQLDTHYWLTGFYQSQAELEKHFNLTADTMKSLEKEINKTLAKRDLPPVAWKSKDEKFQTKLARQSDIDPQFAIACSLLMDTADKRSKSVKLGAVGLSTKKFQVLLEDRKNLAYYQERVLKIFGQADQSAKLSLVKNIEAGDLQSIKYFYEFSGAYRPNEQVQIDLMKIVAMFMEILVRHVSTEVVETVAVEFEKVLGALEK